jgi:hypothetical protein
MSVNRLIYVAALAVPMIIYRRGDENRLVRNLEARGYTNVQIEHPNQWHCYKSHTFSYRARSPSGAPLHGGACVTLFFFTMTTEPIGKK